MADAQQKTSNQLGKQGRENSLDGTANELKGKLEGAAGRLTGDRKLQGEGSVDELKGKAEDAIGTMDSKLAK